MTVNIKMYLNSFDNLKYEFASKTKNVSHELL